MTRQIVGHFMLSPRESQRKEILEEIVEEMKERDRGEKEENE